MGSAEGFDVLPYDPEQQEALEEAVQQAQVILINAVWLAKIPSLSQVSVPVVVDGYAPVLAEVLSRRADDTRWLQSTLAQAYLAGDFFICASERQRDWWLGLLEAHGRINSYTFGADPSLRHLVDVVPFGLQSVSPQHTRQMVKGVWPGIGTEDRIVLWGGGLWPWLDPLTAIRAIAKVWRQRQDVRLIFPGTRHPHPWVAEALSTHNESATSLARELGLLNRAVFFGDWVPYADWPNVLLESDVALTLHYDTLETRLAFRSRVLDYIWADLPIVATRGDATSELITEHGMGIVVDYEDVGGAAEAILHLLETPSTNFTDQFNKARQELTWERAARPLVEFCRHPRQAPDKGTPYVGHPYYQEKLHCLEAETARLRTLVASYERGKFIRFMRYVNRLGQAARHAWK